MFKSSTGGRALKTDHPEYTCKASALMITPPVSLAISIAMEDFPDAVGPAIKIGLRSDKSITQIYSLLVPWRHLA
jgi:hypothetical protein